MARENTAEFRFYEELNDFLAPDQRKRTLPYRFNGNPGIKDPIEVFGVPHTEVDLIIVNGCSVDFDYQLQAGDRVAVYPMFESLDITPLVRIRKQPLRRVAFVLDVNLGKLARRLRFLGFDALYSNRYHDAEIAEIAASEHRILLTRDRRLLFARKITHGYWVRSVKADEQTREVLARFDLQRQVKPLTRCLDCNGVISAVAKHDIIDSLQPKTRRYYEEFFRCVECGKIYWQGSHTEHMRRWLAREISPPAPEAPENV